MLAAVLLAAGAVAWRTVATIRSLDDAALPRATCRSAVFAGASLRGAQLISADLGRASLVGADCRGGFYFWSYSQGGGRACGFDG